MARRVYQKAVGAGGKIVAAAAKGKVPRRTGALGGSIVHRVSSKPKAGLFGVKVTVKAGRFASERTARRKGRLIGKAERVMAPRKSGKARKARVRHFEEYKPDAVERYYRFLETGTKYHAAKPFLAPSLSETAPAVLAAIKSELAAGLEREAAKLTITT